MREPHGKTYHSPTDSAPVPGWYPPKSSTHGEGDCMRLALACVIGIHPEEITWIPPRKVGNQFWRMYADEANRLGFVLAYKIFPRGITWSKAEKPAGLWIGVAPGASGAANSTHAMVFDGDRLHYDSGPPRKRHPNKLFRIVEVIPK